MDSNITFTGVLNFNYAPKVVEVEGIPPNHPVKDSCEPCYGTKVKCSGHNGRTRPCRQCMTRPGVECFFTRSKRPARRGAISAAAPAAAAPPAAAPPAAAGFPMPAAATFGPLGVPPHDANPVDLAWGSIDPFAAAANVVPPAVPAATAAPAAPVASSSSSSLQSQLWQSGCEMHRELYDEPLELSRLVNAPQHAAISYPAELLLRQNSASLRSCWIVVDCPSCADRPGAVAATLEMVREICAIYERVLATAAGAELEPAFPAAPAAVRGNSMLPSPPPSPLPLLRLRLSCDTEEFELLAERVAFLLAPYDPNGAVELSNRARTLRWAAAL
ncbi:hypothetical protein VTH06DRAFT_2883 [Thermothelomyces fergusii]